MTSPAPFSLPAFTAFCREKPAGEEYNATVPSHCALAQFGIHNVQRYRMKGVPMDVLSAAISRPHTFGALADRLDKLGEGR